MVISYIRQTGRVVFLMDKINYFNFCSAILLIIMLISTFCRKMTRGKTNHIFIIVMSICLASSCFDCLAVWADNEDVRNLTLKTILHTGYMVFHNISTPVYILYIISLTDTWHKIYNNKAFQLILAVPIIVVLLLIVMNSFTGVVFYFDENYVYTRGKLMPILYIAAFIYFVFGISYLVRYRELFNKSRYVSLMAMFILMITAVIVQMILPFLLVEMLVNAIGLLFISMMVQRPEETIDVITGLRKYSAYADDMKRGFKNNKPVDVIMINISNFNSLSEILEYDGMNELLKTLADKLLKTKANADMYYLDKGRFRLVVDKRHSDETKDIAEDVNAIFKEDIIMKEMEINILAYVCILTCPDDINDFNTLMAFGKDFTERSAYTGNVIYAKEIIQKSRYDVLRNIDSVIENAIANNKFKIYYQPIYSVEKKCFTSAEALLRLIDDKYGFVSPEIFIPAAEKSGAIHRIGSYVLDEVCRFISGEDFKDLGLEYIEINLSVAQCMHNSLVDEVMRILNKYSVSVDKINLEITETAADNAQSTMTENINALSERGISFSLDDFGTGYSNIRRVASLPLKIVKLDKSFAITDDNNKMLIVLQNTVKMLKAMNMEIVVEGVETESLVKQFSEMKCEYIQGYYYSKPVPEKEFVEFIRKSNLVISA